MKTEQEYVEIFARNLTRQIERSDMSKAQLGALLGVSRATVSDWTNGKVQPRLPMFFRICEALGCSPDTLGGFHSGTTSKAVNEYLDAYLDAPRPIQQAVDGLLHPYKKGSSSASLA